MAKNENKEATTWGGKMKEFGGGNFTFLSTDGETLIFIVVGLPVLMKGTYKGKEQERIGCPIVTDEGFQLLVCGKRLARMLSKQEKIFKTHAIMVTRIGIEGDVNAKYPVRVLPEQETFDRLVALSAEDFSPEMIAEAVEAASKVLQG